MVALRRLMFLLLAVNVLVLLWHVVRPVTRGESQQNSEILLPPLVYIDEHSQDLMPVLSGLAGGQTQALGMQDASLVSDCWVSGPFDSDAAATDAMRSSGFAARVQLLRSEVEGPPLYRAMLAPSASRDEAVLRLSEVVEVIERVGGGIDTYIVTSGSIANAVSLGLFVEHANALNVQSVLAAEGVDVLVEPENRLETAYWVVADGIHVADIDSENMISKGFARATAELSENLCEMIAQAE